MELMVNDLYEGENIHTGQIFQKLNPPSVHHTLSKKEIELSYGLYQGSGGSISGFFSSVLSGANNIPCEMRKQNNKLSKTVQDIGSVFSLTKDELAQVCNIQSRKTLYNWIDGVSTPRKTAMSRIFDLSLITQAWQQSGLPNDSESIHRPVVDGLCVFDFLTNEKLDKDLILFAGSRLNLSSDEKKVLQDPFQQ